MLAASTTLQRRVLAGQRRLLGDTHFWTLESELALADTLVEMNELDEAREIRDRLLPVVTRILGPDNRLAHWLNRPDFLVNNF